MCGIYGIIDLNGSENSDTSELISMMQKSRYRGPDSQQTKQFSNIQLGFNRLSIIDLDERSNQPFYHEKLNLTIVFNGEIFNYLELKKELINLGFEFHTESDTEVLLTLYFQYKEQAFNKLIGMWAFAIYDHSNNTLLFCRDRLGFKPLYYMQQDEKLYFSSEIKSLLCVKHEKIYNLNSTTKYELLGLNTSIFGETFVHGIFEFPTGSYARISGTKLIFNKYYHAPTTFINPTVDDAKDYLYESFKSAVKLRLRTDVPLAILLSSGLDSSALIFMIDKLISDGEIQVDQIHAFTLNFIGFNNNEWERVQENAKHLKHIKCHPIDIDIEHFKSEIPALIGMFDLPVLSVSHLLHFKAIQEIKKQGFTVLLNGQGPDEIYGGYFPKDMGYLLLDYVKKSISGFLQEVKSIKRNWCFSNKIIIRAMLKAYFHFHFTNYFYKIKSISVSHNFYAVFNRFTSWRTTKMSYFDFSSRKQVFESKFNGILQYEDMASMLNSMEMRSPFLDFRIVNYGISLPSEFKLRDGHSKWILRKAFENLLPPEINWASWKLGYAVPKTVLMANILPKNHKTDEKSLNDFWRKYNLEVWLKHHNIQ